MGVLFFNPYPGRKKQREEIRRGKEEAKTEEKYTIKQRMIKEQVMAGVRERGGGELPERNEARQPPKGGGTRQKILIFILKTL